MKIDSALILVLMLSAFNLMDKVIKDALSDRMCQKWHMELFWPVKGKTNEEITVWDYLKMK